MKLIHILANDHRPDTLHFAMEMITNGETSDTQKLGLELLSLLDVPQNSSFVSDTLIAATYAVSNPEIMAQLIHQLSQHPTDETTKERITDRLQTMLSESDPDIRAAAIDSLAEISQPRVIQDLSRNYLFDPSNQVKNAAISALFKLNKTEVDEELLQTLIQLIQDPIISGETKRLATAVLETYDVPVSN
ncbi:HEAT repeat domain-containing protein [Vibrio sp. PP-XX7]